MAIKDKRIDIYIENSTDFAKPILKHLRDIVHKSCPEAEETMKWSFPHFDFRGEMMCSMASFKQHCAFGFWKASLMKDSEKLFQKTGKTAMGQLGQIKSLSDLPPDKILTASIREAMKLNENGVILTKSKRVSKNEIEVPLYLKKELKSNPAVYRIFENFSPSHKREYLEWIIEAKTEETRNRRMANALEMISEGKTRNWKYMQKKTT